MADANPDEIVVGALAIYLAAAIEALDSVSAAPSGNWALMGTSGDENYAEAGIVVTHSQTLRQTFVVGATGPRRVNRQQEQLTIALTLMDIGVAEYTKVLNGTTKSTDTTPNIDYIGLRRGPDVKIWSLTAWGDKLSPAGPTLDMAFYVPRCYQSADPAPTFSKDAEAALAVVFTALEYTAAATDEERFGRLIVETS